MKKVFSGHVKFVPYNLKASHHRSGCNGYHVSINSHTEFVGTFTASGKPSRYRIIAAKQKATYRFLPAATALFCIVQKYP